jgi:O-antigen/teichoic acid export membrane protein
MFGEKPIIAKKSGAPSNLSWGIISNAGWASAATLISVGLGVVQTGMLARLLGPEGLGVLALFAALCALFGSLCKINSAETAMVFVTRAISDGDKPHARQIVNYCFLIDVLTSLLAGAAVALSALLLPQLLHLPPGSERLLAFFGLSLVFQSTYWTSHALLRVADRFAWTFYHATSHSLLKTGLVAVLFWQGRGLDEVVFVLIILSLFDGVILLALSWFALSRMGLRHVAAHRPWWEVPRELYQFQLLGYGRQVVKSANRYLDMLLIGFLTDPVQVGLFRASKQIGDLLTMPGNWLLASLAPEYSRLWFSRQKERLARLVRRFTAGLALAGLAAAISLAFLINWIIRVVLGPGFAEAAPATLILLISGIILLSMTPASCLPGAVGRAGPALRAVIVALPLQVALMFFLVPRFGAIGAAWSNVGYFVAWSLALAPSIFEILRLDGPSPGVAEKEMTRKQCPAD